jgi:Tfp pilus assembly protein FimT
VTDRQRPISRSSAGGFTLNELLLVVVILTLIVGLALPRLDWTAYRLRGEVRAVQLLLAFAGRLAVSLQHDVQVTIDHRGRRVIIHEDANNDGTFEQVEQRRAVQLNDGINFERLGAPDLPPPRPTTELDRMIFRRDGSADRAGVVFMNTERALNLRTTDDARVLEIVRATGRAVAYKYTPAGWRPGS